MHPVAHPPRAQTGFTLIEVLITVFVLAVGLLALAALQTRSLRDTAAAQMRSTATLLAYDIADRMRANASGLSGYVRTDTGAITLTVPDKLCTAASSDAIAANVCTATELASADLYQWLLTLTDGRNGLPDARATIACDGGDCNVATAVRTVTISWSQSRTTADTTGQSVVLRYQP